MRSRGCVVLCLLSLMSLLFILPARSATLYVKAGGAGDGSSWASPLGSVSAAVSAAAAGDEVWVAAGTYSGTVPIAAGIGLYGGFAGAETARDQRNPSANATVLDGNQQFAAVIIAASATGAVVDGFTIRNGAAYGVDCAGPQSVLANNSITGNGGYSDTNPGGPMRSDVDVIGWGVNVQATAVGTAIRGNAITGNEASVSVQSDYYTGYAFAGGIYSKAPDLLIERNLLTDNHAYASSSPNPHYASAEAYAMYLLAAGAVVRNNMVIRNSCGLSAQASVSVVNNTFLENGAASVDDFGYVAASVLLFSGGTVANNIVSRNSYGVYTTGTISHNCVFGNASGDYASGSAAHATDINVDPLLVGTKLQSTSPCVDAGDDAYVVPGETDFYGKPRVIGSHVDIGAAESDGSAVPIPSRIWYVSPAGNDANDGTSWARAKKSLRDTLAKAVSGEDVWVASGSWSDYLTVPPGVRMYGGFAGTEAQLSQRNPGVHPTALSYEVTCRSPGVVVDGFTLRDSSNVVSAGDGTVLANDIIVGSYRGIWASGSVTLVNCTVLGGMWGLQQPSGSLTVVNSVFVGCQDAISVEGGTATLVNNTIVGNGRGVHVTAKGTAHLSNNIVAFNSLYGIAQDVGGVCTFSHNDVFGNASANYSGVTAGATDLSSDPRFLDRDAGNLRLEAGSPCIDAGDDSAVSPAGTDADGRPRVVGDHVDIGAYEAGVPSRAWRVAPAGDDANDGSTWARAKRTVGAALASARGGDEVWVAQGIYRETIMIPSGVGVYGGFGGTESQRGQRDRAARPTVLDGTTGATYGAVVYGDAIGIVLDGLTVRNGYSGANMEGIARLVNNTFTANRGWGISVGSYGQVLLANNTMTGNATGAMVGGTTTLTNNTIVSNSGYGVEVYGKVSFRNNIISYNGRSGIYRNNESYQYGTLLAQSRNDVYGNGGGPYTNVSSTGTDFTLDPKLSSLYRDIHLQPGSPCIDAGDGSAVTPGDTDQYGKPRVIGARVDIGADESDGTTWTIPARVWYVSSGGDDAADGATWRTARKTVAAALSVTQGGDEVWVAKGTYAGLVTVPAGVALYGGFAGTESQRGQRDRTVNRTVLDGGGSTEGIVVGMPYTGAVLDGFAVQNGANGVYADGMTTIANTSISGNRYTGLAGRYSDLKVRNSTISGNGGSGLSNGGKTVLTNDTITGNGGNGVKVSYAGSSLSVTNCIVAFNGGYGMIVSQPGTTVTPPDHNDVYGNLTGGYSGLAPGATDIAVDPKLTSNFRDGQLLPGSPCIDAGNDTAVLPGETDQNGEPRITGAHVDIGADEYDGTVQIVPPRVWYVSPSGSEAGDGASWATAKRSINGALASAMPGDEVWAAKGVYAEKISLRTGVGLYGGFDGTEAQRSQRDLRANLTLIDGGGSTDTPVVRCDWPGSWIDGFTIRNAYRGVLVSIAATVAHCTITGNGDGVYMATDAKATLVDNLIAGNTGHGVFVYGPATLTNNTVVGNTNHGVYVGYFGNARLANNIIASNGYFGVYNDGGKVSFRSRNDVYGNTYGPYASSGTIVSGTEIEQDPLFVGPAGGDYRLQAGSPCIDAGDDTALTPGETDLIGTPRILGAHVDIGAYEYGAADFYSFADVRDALRIAGGFQAANPDSLVRLNVLAGGDGTLDLRDAVALARKAAGLSANP